MHDKKPCQSCQRFPAITGLRYCGTCTARIKREMRDSNYLTKDWQPNQVRHRTPDWREDRHETAFGLDA